MIALLDYGSGRFGTLTFQIDEDSSQTLLLALSIFFRGAPD